jgi:hypothetical protein
MNGTLAGMSADLADVAERLAARLATPPPPTQWAGWGQNLTDGAVGIALLHIERARTGQGTWTTAHTWLAAATTGPVAATTGAGLFLGARPSRSPCTPLPAATSAHSPLWTRRCPP